MLRYKYLAVCLSVGLFGCGVTEAKGHTFCALFSLFSGTLPSKRL